MKFRCLWVLAVAGTCGVAPVAHAAEPLRLQEAVARALASHPSLIAESAQLDAVQARASREALPTAYVVGAEIENFAGTGTLSGIRSSEATVRIGRTIELGGKRLAREALGHAEVNLQVNEVDRARIDIASRTAARFIVAIADQERLAYTEQRVAQAERTRREVASWVDAARNPEADLRAAEIALAEAELERERVRHSLESARVTLAASWGAQVPDFDTLAGDLEDLPAVEAFDALAARLPRTPEQQSARLEFDTIAARRRIAEAAARPDLNLGLGLRRVEGIDDQALVMSISVPLGNRVRSRFTVAEADAQLQALEARRQAEYIERRQALFERYQELIRSRSEAESLRTHMLPKAEEALAATRRAFETGRLSFFALAQAQKTLFELRERAIEAAARYHTLRVEVERLTAVAEDATP